MVSGSTAMMSRRWSERSPDGLPVRFEDEDAYEGSLKAEGAAA